MPHDHARPDPGERPPRASAFDPPRQPARPKLPEGWFLLELARTGSPGHLVLAPDGARAPAGWRFEPAGFTPVALDTFVRVDEIEL